MQTSLLTTGAFTLHSCGTSRFHRSSHFLHVLPRIKLGSSVRKHDRFRTKIIHTCRLLLMNLRPNVCGQRAPLRECSRRICFDSFLSPFSTRIPRSQASLDKIVTGISWDRSKLHYYRRLSSEIPFPSNIQGSRHVAAPPVKHSVRAPRPRGPDRGLETI